MTSRWTNAEAPDGCRIYAVGDIHGRADLLDIMIGKIICDHEARPEARPIVIFLGDYIDRGPSSRMVIDRLIEGLPSPFETHCLKGNHEELFLSFLGDPFTAPAWLLNGGYTTLSSYGIDQALLRSALQYDPASLMRLASRLRESLPEEHLKFLLSLSLFHRFGDYFFVHAGVRPGISLEHQKVEDMLWIRDEFLNWPYEFRAVIVHGHTPVLSPEDLRNRIGIDTYAWNTGRLTAVALEGSERRFLTAVHESDESTFS